jgi:hypothetical protein
MTLRDLATHAWAAGWAEHGSTPLPQWARTAAEAAIGLALDNPDPTVLTFLTETGAVEGRRDKREQRRRTQYAAHTALLLAVARRLTTTVDATQLANILAPHLEAGFDALKDAALEDLQRQARMVDGLNVAWQQTNVDAYTAAVALGTAEAASTPAGGGPPDPALMDDAVLAATGGLTSALAWSFANDWTSEQLGGLAGDLARAAQGTALDALPEALSSTLDDLLGVAFYAGDEQVAATTYGYLQLLTANANVNFVTVGDSRVDGICRTLEGLSPYPADTAPAIPVHGGCRCHLEATAPTSALAIPDAA